MRETFYEVINGELKESHSIGFKTPEAAWRVHFCQLAEQIDNLTSEIKRLVEKRQKLHILQKIAVKKIVELDSQNNLV